jgi:hypothetical protein
MCQSEISRDNYPRRCITIVCGAAKACGKSREKILREYFSKDAGKNGTTIKKGSLAAAL